ncbi:MAG: 4-alpha-glucanotransferase, partial [Halobacteriovoraceae bacterium]|nr:4-alpha-glucanotransferase [Halobacteriovoraceae bacterium]
LKSRSQNIIFPLQDVFDLSEEARLNIPGTTKDNWIWRMNTALWDEESWELLRVQLKEFNRSQLP